MTSGSGSSTCTGSTDRERTAFGLPSFLSASAYQTEFGKLSRLQRSPEAWWRCTWTRNWKHLPAGISSGWQSAVSLQNSASSWWDSRRCQWEHRSPGQTSGQSGRHLERGSHALLGLPGIQPGQEQGFVSQCIGRGTCWVPTNQNCRITNQN